MLQINSIISKASQFRLAIEATCKTELHITMSLFPRGACGDASLLLGQFLLDSELGQWEYVQGIREEDGHSHAWIINGQLIVDITADQFLDIQERIIVREDWSWHAQFKAKSRGYATLDLFGEPLASYLRDSYKVILRNLKK